MLLLLFGERAQHCPPWTVKVRDHKSQCATIAAPATIRRESPDHGYFWWPPHAVWSVVWGIRNCWGIANRCRPVSHCRGASGAPLSYPVLEGRVETQPRRPHNGQVRLHQAIWYTVPYVPTSEIGRASCRAIHCARITDRDEFEAAEREAQSFLIDAFDKAWNSKLCKPVTFYAQVTTRHVLELIQGICVGNRAIDILDLQYKMWFMHTENDSIAQ